VVSVCGEWDVEWCLCMASGMLSGVCVWRVDCWVVSLSGQWDVEWCLCVASRMLSGVCVWLVGC